MIIEFEKSVLIPIKTGNCYSELTAAMISLEIGNSLFLPGKDHCDIASYKKRITKRTGRLFEAHRARKEEIIGIRLWRIS